MKPFLLILLFSTIFSIEPSKKSNIQGAWKSENAVIIFSGNYFAFTSYSTTEFGSTFGGSFLFDGNNMMLNYEFHTEHPEKVGSTQSINIKINKKIMSFLGEEFKQIDDGKPGELEGAWLFANRMRDGQLGNPRSADNPRKTMKILSGTRFQWIAYNVETKQFMGTGGGTYTATNGKYTENIDFFSRDNSRVGASLSFDFERKDNDWHHQGLSSKGDPIYEIWSLRK